MDVKNYISVGFGLFLAVMIFGNFVSAQINISMYDYLINPGVGSIPHVPINISNCTNVGSAQIIIYYDISILNATFCSFNAANFVSGLCDTHPPGEINLQIGASHPHVVGPCTAGTINFNVNTTAVGKKSNLSIRVVEFVDKSVPPQSLSHIVRNGSVTISCVGATCPAGTFCNTTTHLCQPTTIICYGDADNDTFGNLTNTTTAIGACPAGYRTNSLDCDDYNASINPNANETLYGMNVKDDDCDGIIDDCSPANSLIDALHYCNATSRISLRKGFNETCDAHFECLSNNCTAGRCAGYMCYGDADNDTFGNPANFTVLISPPCPPGYRDNKDDCNDYNASIRPGVLDIPNNGIDENCNGRDNITCYADLDNDNYTNNTNIVYNDIPGPPCPANRRVNATAHDCNDYNSTINPGANETHYGVNGIDNDCNNITDDCSPANRSIDTLHYCNATSRIALKKGPNATCVAGYECLTGNCTNNTCMGYICYRDADGDGFGNATNTITTINITCPHGYVNISDDCNDHNSTINPRTVWYRDDDNDTYGNMSVTSCIPPAGNWVLRGGDCNDNDTRINPGMDERKGKKYVHAGVSYYTSRDNIDNDCDGIIDEECHKDADCGANYYCWRYKCYSRGVATYTEVVEFEPPRPENITLKEFLGVPTEVVGLGVTFDLGIDARGAEVVVRIGNRTVRGIVGVNGTVTITLPEYGQGEITVSKPGFKSLTQTIIVYAGILNITKISGEKYGDEFIFKVTTEKGIPVKDAAVEVYGQTLKTDAEGIVKIRIKTIQANLVASTLLKDYKGSTMTFDVKAIGTLKIEVPEKAKEGDIITIIVRDEKGNPVPNTKVIINDVEHTTDAEGKIRYNVTTSLTLKAEKEGYVPSERVLVTVEPKPEPEPPKPPKPPEPAVFPWWLIIVVIVILLIVIYLLVRKKKKAS